MIRVANKKCISNLSRKSLAASKTRNIITVLAIALTTILFTALFTIALSINDSFQESNFRQVGGFSHGGFKRLTKEQYLELKDDPMIKEYGVRRFLGMPRDVPFNKSQVEISYSDKNNAHWMYCDPIEGRLPEEGTNEAATDISVLELLGVTPELGAEFTITFPVDGIKTTQTFTLCGWWERDEAIVASHILIPESRVDAVLQEVGVTPPGKDNMTGSFNLDVMLKSSTNIGDDLDTILANHGYQSEDPSGEELPYIRKGVNWGYTGAQLSESMDLSVVFAIAGMLLLIIFTGYLIIYNVFRISVVGDIRFYGLLKTIGTTGRQVKRLLRYQAMLLSGCGIPLGLLMGWLIGSWLTPVVLSRLNGMAVDVVSVNPLIFFGAAVFSLLTVLLSCAKPGRMAARISPIEAVRYTEGSDIKKTTRRKQRAVRFAGHSYVNKKGVSVFSLALANLGRSKSKTIVTIASLSLAVVLLNTTVLFTRGFDMDKYLASNSVSDFIVANASYFRVGSMFSAEAAVEDGVTDSIADFGGITEGGKVYGQTKAAQEFVSEEYYRQLYSSWYSQKQLDEKVASAEKTEDGKLMDRVSLLGMEAYALDRLHVLEGDLRKLYEPGGNYIAAVYMEDDYGTAEMGSHWAKVGDKVKLRYVEEFEYYNPDTGEIYEDLDAIGDRPVDTRTLKYTEKKYEVVALVSVPNALSYRYYGADQFVLNDQTFIRDTGSNAVMLYAFDTTDQANVLMEQFLEDYTTNVNPSYDYESKAKYQAEFESFRRMFLLLGGVLSFIVGMIGVLNFVNAILTGIITRKREFAMLQSIGMSGRQLKGMLVFEGLLYALGSAVFALVLSLLLGPVMASAMSSMFWFFTYRLTVAPILIIAPVLAVIGAIVPLLVYRVVARQTIVERLRETEG